MPTQRALPQGCRPAGWLLAALAAALGGCTTWVDVQTLATGRSGVSAYALNGDDLDLLRREAQRLCPLGGEIVRQFGSQQRQEPVDGRWRKALNTTALWLNPPQQSAQLVVLCQERADRFRLQAAAAPVVPVLPPAAASRAAAPAAAASPPELTAALPVGPVMPEW